MELDIITNLMPQSAILVAVEIGTSKTCVAVGEVSKDNSLRVLGISDTRSAGIRKGEISNLPQAREGLKTALLEAEDLFDLRSINNVYLSITGSHIQGSNCRGTYRLPEDEHEIANVHLDEVEDIALDIGLPGDRVHLLNTIRHYELDEHRHDVAPLLLSGRTLSAEYHSIHGVRNRIENCIRCVRENALELEDVVFAPLASALAALNKRDKESGALVIDLGGGTTDYILYLEGAISASGCIPVGGDHVTNDIHMATRTPFTLAEKLKIKEGNTSGEAYMNVGMAQIPDAETHHDSEVPRATLNQVIHARVEETLDLVLNRLPPDCLDQIGTGVFLTGGASQQDGIVTLTNKIFGLPVYQSEAANDECDDNSIWAPQYSTVIGLLRYAQIMEAEQEKEGWFRKLVQMLWPY